jgi:hypothetical protein
VCGYVVDIGLRIEAVRQRPDQRGADHRQGRG